MARAYPYHKAWDAGQASDLILRAVDLCHRRWQTVNYGTYANRPMRDFPAHLSTHATGMACDLAYKDETQARAMWDFFVGNSLALNVAALHWYRFGKFGAGYRCDRGEGKRGVRIYRNRTESAGTGGAWLHLELVDMNPDEWEARFRALKP